MSEEIATADANLTHIAALKGRLEETEQERDDYRSRFETARKRGDAYLGKIGTARLILAGDPENDLVDQAHAVQLQLGQALTDAAEWEALYTAALVDLHRARADAAARLEVCRNVLSFWQRYVDRTGPAEPWATSVLVKLRESVTSHPGAVSLLTELEAARGVVTIARRGFGTSEDIEKAKAFDPVALRHAIERYDAARQGDGE